MTRPTLLIGLGNPDRGDDAVGLHVARRLAARGRPGVAVTEADGDALALLDRWADAARVVVVDAAEPAGQPGRVHRLDPLSGPLPRELRLGSTHGFGLAEAVELARTLGRLPARITIFAIEAAQFEPGAALSAPVAAAVAAATARVVAELAEDLADA